MPSAIEVSDQPPPDLSQQIPKLIPRGPAKSFKARPKPTPPPVTPTLPSPPQELGLRHIHPTRRILSPQDHELFLASPTYTLIVAFVFTIADSVQGTSVSDLTKNEPSRHPAVESLLAILSKAQDLVKECPADDTNGSRFGNPAFRTYLTTLSDRVTQWHKTQFPSLSEAALEEVTTYFLSSLGSASRIDYGSGHELHYMIYLLCLYQLSELPQSAFPSVALLVLPEYLQLMRTLQSTYYLEPAGSHGVWGLDDYHFVPFLFGASQLIGHPFIRPMGIHSATTLEAYGDDYLYLEMVRQVNATKTVEGLRWHSPMLDDISGVKGGWEKVCEGLKKMFLGEVLGKLVVMQHFLFGGLVPAAEGMSEESELDAEVIQESPSAETVEAIQATGDTPAAHPAHAHNDNSWGDCCGIKVPSSIGAIQEMKKRTGNSGLRRLPFD